MSNSDAAAGLGIELAVGWIVADVACGSMPSSAISCAPLLSGAGGVRFVGTVLDELFLRERVAVTFFAGTFRAIASRASVGLPMLSPMPTRILAWVRGPARSPRRRSPRTPR